MASEHTPTLGVAARTRDGWFEIDVAGDLCWPAAVELQKTINQRARPAGERVLLNLDRVTAIDRTGSAILGAMVADRALALHVVLSEAGLHAKVPFAGIRNMFPTRDQAIFGDSRHT